MNHFKLLLRLPFRVADFGQITENYLLTAGECRPEADGQRAGVNRVRSGPQPLTVAGRIFTFTALGEPIPMDEDMDNLSSRRESRRLPRE